MGSEVSEVNTEMTGLHDQVKRKVSPALIYVTRNDGKWGGLTVEFRAFVTSALDKVSGQLNVTAVLTPEERPRQPQNGKAQGPTYWSGRFKDEKNHTHLLPYGHQTPVLLSSSCRTLAILITL
jgi:hypothetical protein